MVAPSPSSSSQYTTVANSLDAVLAEEHSFLQLLCQRDYARAKYICHKMLDVCQRKSPQDTMFLWKCMVELAPGLLDHLTSSELRELIELLQFLDSNNESSSEDKQQFTRSLLVSVVLSLEDITYRRKESQQQQQVTTRRSRSKHPWPLRVHWNSMKTLQDIVLQKDDPAFDIIYLSWVSSKLISEKMNAVPEFMHSGLVDILRRRGKDASNLITTKRLRECLQSWASSKNSASEKASYLLSPIHLPRSVITCVANSHFTTVAWLSNSYPSDDDVFGLQTSAITGLLHRVQFMQTARKWRKQFGDIPKQALDRCIASAEALVGNYSHLRRLFAKPGENSDRIAKEGKSLYFMCAGLSHTFWMRLRSIEIAEDMLAEISFACRVLRLMDWIHAEDSMEQHTHVLRLAFELRNAVIRIANSVSLTQNLHGQAANPLDTLINTVVIFSNSIPVSDRDLWAATAILTEHFLANEGSHEILKILDLCCLYMKVLEHTPRVSTTCSQLIVCAESRLTNSTDNTTSKDITEIMERAGSVYYLCHTAEQETILKTPLLNSLDNFLKRLLQQYPMETRECLCSLGTDALSGLGYRSTSGISSVQTIADLASQITKQEYSAYASYPD